DHFIQLKGVQAQIPDLAHEAVLSIVGETSAEGSAYLGLMKQSPLGELLGHVLDEATTDGLWRVPLDLTIPLTRAEETSVKGSILFAGSRLSLMPGTPGFTKLTGKLD